MGSWPSTGHPVPIGVSASPRRARSLTTSTRTMATSRTLTVGEASGSIEQTNKTSMRALVLRKKQQLVEEFVAADAAGTGKVTIDQWGAIMVKVTGVVSGVGDSML